MMNARPFEDRGPFDTVFWETGGVGDSTDWEGSWLVEHVEGAFIA